MLNGSVRVLYAAEYVAEAARISKYISTKTIDTTHLQGLEDIASEHLNMIKYKVKKLRSVYLNKQHEIDKYLKTQDETLQNKATDWKNI